MSNYKIINPTNNQPYALILNKGQTNGYIEPDNINLETDPLNFQMIGTPTGSEESGKICLGPFSTENYLLTPKAINLNTVDTFEIVIAYKGNSGSILQQNSATPYTVCVDYSGVLVRLEGDSGWSTVCNNLSNDSTTKYWTKLTFNGTSYIASRSTDGINYTVAGSLTTTKKIISNLQPFVIGTNDLHVDPFQGKIYPADSYIKINGQMWWQGGSGTLTLKAGSKLYYPNGISDTLNCNIINNVNIDNGIASNFSINNYLKPNPAINLNSGDSWEINMAFKGSKGDIVGIAETSSSAILIISPTKFVVSGNTIAVIDDCNKNTKYWYKLSFTGSEYFAYRSTDGETFTLLGSLALSGKLYSGSNIYFGFKPYGGESDVFDGEIDISQSYIKIDNEIAWQGGTGNRLFIETVTTTDSSIALYSTGSSSKQLFTDQNGSLFAIDSCRTYRNYVSATSSYYYNSEGNLFYKGGSTGGLTLSSISLPLAMVTYSLGNITIDEVYNGVGYMGSTVYILPGTKFFAADGGTSIYQNIEFEVLKILVCSFFEGITDGNINTFIDSEKSMYYIGKYYNQAQTPEISTSVTNFWYNPNTNIMMKAEKYSSTFSPVNMVRLLQAGAINGNSYGYLFYNGTNKSDDLINKNLIKYLVNTGENNDNN